MHDFMATYLQTSNFEQTYQKMQFGCKFKQAKVSSKHFVSYEFSGSYIIEYKDTVVVKMFAYPVMQRISSVFPSLFGKKKPVEQVAYFQLVPCGKPFHKRLD